MNRINIWSPIVNTDRNEIALVAWEDITKPKNLGVLLLLRSGIKITHYSPNGGGDLERMKIPHGFLGSVPDWQWVVDKPFKELFPDLYAIESCKSILISECVFCAGSNNALEMETKHIYFITRGRSTMGKVFGDDCCHFAQFGDGLMVWLREKSGKFSIATMRTVVLKPSMGIQTSTHSWLKWLYVKIKISVEEWLGTDFLQ
ncbi:hypothetical protein E3N88_08889 [Mikania micrantha]|uniref:Uncharacterized protein n=1 Tax=Mikania micrantha TaxID=192012 RepID=A0A5N6PJT9_9ASTR|nr:hypothetical protein E3N88_08889 [Mikania micrantha]